MVHGYRTRTSSYWPVWTLTEIWWTMDHTVNSSGICASVLSIAIDPTRASLGNWTMWLFSPSTKDEQARNASSLVKQHFNTLCFACLFYSLFHPAKLLGKSFPHDSRFDKIYILLSSSIYFKETSVQESTRMVIPVRRSIYPVVGGEAHGHPQFQPGGTASLRRKKTPVLWPLSDKIW